MNIPVRGNVIFKLFSQEYSKSFFDTLKNFRTLNRVFRISTEGLTYGLNKIYVDNRL